MKIKKFLCVVLLAGGVFAACSDDENGIEDYPLNYEIPQITPTADIPVGAYLVDPSTGTNDVQWGRLTDPYIDDRPASEGGGKVGPYVMPTQGRYRFYTADSTHSIILKNFVHWAKQAGIDFLITPSIRENVNAIYPMNLNANDTLLVNLISGRVDTFAYANRGEIKYAISFDINNWSTSGNGNTGPNRGSLSNNNLLESTDDDPYQFTYRYTPAGWPTQINAQGKEVPVAPYPKDSVFRVTRTERLYNIFKRLAVYFHDPTYQTTPDGRPLLFLESPQKLYTAYSKQVYDNIRDTVRKYSGKEVFIVARQEKYTPCARWEYFFLQGEVDAIVENNLVMPGGGQWDVTYIQNVLINEHIKENKKYLDRSHPNIDYLPSVTPSYSQYVVDGNYAYPLIRKDPAKFRERCNICKMNLGRLPMVIVDSFNHWQYDTQIEPTDPDYGYGYGTTYLDILREEFKVRR